MADAYGDGDLCMMGKRLCGGSFYSWSVLIRFEKSTHFFFFVLKYKYECQKIRNCLVLVFEPMLYHKKGR